MSYVKIRGFTSVVVHSRQSGAMVMGPDGVYWGYPLTQRDEQEWERLIKSKERDLFIEELFHRGETQGTFVISAPKTTIDRIGADTLNQIARELRDRQVLSDPPAFDAKTFLDYCEKKLAECETRIKCAVDHENYASAGLAKSRRGVWKLVINMIKGV